MNAPISGKKVASKQVHFEYPGLHIIQLDELIELEEGSNFSVHSKTTDRKNL